MSSEALQSVMQRVKDGGEGLRTRGGNGAHVQYWGVPSPVLTRFDRFFVCDECGKCYWDGSHMQRFLSGKVASMAVTSA